MSTKPGGHKPPEVTRVICASVSRVQGSVMNELFEIRNRVCAEGDTARRVNGAILYSSGWFIMWLEGPAGAVEELVQRAARDRRNAHQKIIHHSVGAASLTEPLTVAATQGHDGATDFARRIYLAREEFQQGVGLEPAALWQRLSAPCTVSPRGARATLPVRHLAVVASQDNAPIDMLRKLGDRFNSQVVYQRFASAKRNSSDVGVAYVDMPAARHVRRVQLLSRRALGHSMVRQSLRSLHGLVLLLGTRPEAAIDLARSVAACVRTLPSPPTIYLVNGGEGVAESVGSLLRQSAAANDPARVVHVPQSEFAELLLDGATA